MSWRDRPYSGDEHGSELRIQFPKPTSTVMWLIAVNVAVFLVHTILNAASGHRSDWFSDFFGLSYGGVRRAHLWQLVTYMFVHASVMHLLFNMLLLYFLGIEFERTFGRERFLQFYSICGVCGGLAYLVLSMLNERYSDVPIVGASGAIYGILVAAMIFFPSMKLFFYFFPVPIRVFGLILVGIWAVGLLSREGLSNPGGELCHAAGAATGVATFYAWGMMPRLRLGSGRLAQRRREGAWARKQRQLADEQAEVDRILEKIHTEGLNSLTRKERKILAEATRQQREREQQLDRMDRL